VVDRAVAEEPSVAGQVEGFQERLAQELAAVIRTDLHLSPVRAQVWAHATVGMVRVAGEWWLTAQSVSRARLVKELVDLLFPGLSSELDAT
jgi:hypothetical protein